MSKIVLITECLTKGIGKHITDLYSQLNSEENEIYVLYGLDRSDDNFIRLIKPENRIEVKHLKEKIGFNDISSVFEIKKILRRIKPDVVHLHSSKAGLSGRIAAKLCGIKKIIYSPHAYFFLKQKEKSLKFKMFLFAEKVLSKMFTDYTITTSTGEDKVYSNYKIDKNDKKVFIPHGIIEPIVLKSDIAKERKKYNISEKDILIGAMARFEEQKDPNSTFKILDKISKKDNVKSIFFGDGSMYEEIKKKADEKNSNVILPGNIDNPELDLRILDIYLTASLYEGLPYTLVQSLALARPIVATNVVGNSDCVIDGKNGYLFEVHNVDKAVENINKIIEDNLFDNMSKESYKLYRNKYSIDTMITKYKNIYGIGVK